MDKSEDRTVAVSTSTNDPSGRHEPGVLRCGRLLWRRRRLIVLGSLLPAVLVGALLVLAPTKYTVTFVYERPLTESEHNVLLRRFYSSENLDKIIGRLREGGVSRYAAKLQEAQTEAGLEEWIRFSVSPAYPKRLQTTDPMTSELISAFRAQLLIVDISGDSKEQTASVSAVVTDNIETMLPVYEIRNALKESIQEYKALAAEIETNRFAASVELQKERKRLQKLTALDQTPTGVVEGNVVLEFTDLQENRQFLPLPYQVRAVQSKIIDLEEKLESDQQKYSHYLKVIDLNDRLLNTVETNILTPYTVAQFLEFLGAELLASEDEALADYLKSYIRRTQNLALVNTRAGERPVVYPVSKNVAEQSILVLVVFLMITVLAAVALEYRGRRRAK